MKFQSVLVVGGGGYVGSSLVGELLNAGYAVTVFDTFWFGNAFLPRDNPKLKLVAGDIRDVEKFEETARGHDAVINLACISNDSSFELNEALSTSINLDAFQPIVRASKRAGVSRFIYASSSSVYGVSDQPNVTENHPLIPLTLYNRYKGMCEPLLFDEVDSGFVGVAIRPATLCGYAPRQRLDLSVNILTTHGFHNGIIKVFGGEQMRPNLHIKDMVRAYLLLLEAEDEKVQGEVFNCGYENLSIMEIAELVQSVIPRLFPDRDPPEIEVSESDDLRSYHVNSEKFTRVLGFEPENSVEDAIADLCGAFVAGLIPNPFDDDGYYNVRRMLKLGVK